MSWDRFVVPYPFGQGVFIWGKPIWVEPHSNGAGSEAKRLELETALKHITLEADQCFRSERQAKQLE